MFLLILVVFIGLQHNCLYADDNDWTVTVKPAGTPEYFEKYKVMWIKARNSSSSVHIFVSASERFSTPSILCVHSNNPNSEPQIDWNHIEEKGRKLVKLDHVTQFYGLIFFQVTEYNDTEDNLNMSSTNPEFIVHPFNKFSWSLNTTKSYEISSETNTAEITFNGTRDLTGQVDLKFRISNKTQRGSDMPHLQFIPGWNMHFDVIFNNLTTNFSQARFGLQLAYVSSLNLNDYQEFFRENVFSIDDEIAPGNFEMYNILLNQPNETKGSHVEILKPGGFVQIKPICYTDFWLRDIKTSRDVYIDEHQELLSPHSSDILLDSFVFTFSEYSPVKSNNSVGVRLMSIRLGTPSDGFYQSSNYIIWSASFGLGSPPVDTLSTLLIGLIALSFIIIAVSLVIGSFVTCVIHKRMKNPNFSRLVETPVA